MRLHLSISVTLLFIVIAIGAKAQTRNVVGRIIAFNRIPIQKAEITVKSTNEKFYSDSLGIFRINCGKKEKLHINANGFVSQVVSPAKYPDSVLINLIFKDGEENIKIATGYGHIDKEKLTYAIKHLSYENCKLEYYANIFDMLKSKAPNVNVNGEIVTIRGRNASGDGFPLFVVDGCIIGYESFKSIDPNTVKAIDVLNDAASSSRYGSRGMNGVIVVSLKKNND